MGWSKIQKAFNEFVLSLSMINLCKSRTTNLQEASRIINRDGKVQINLDHLSLGKRRRYWRNPLTSVLYLKWRWIMIIFTVSFLLTWLFFAVVYYVIAKVKGDLEAHEDPEYAPCINGLNSFTSAFLFSLESQHTIGYGYRNPHADCKAATAVVFLQFIIGVAVQCISAGIVVAKLQTGKRAPKTIVFSEKACLGVCEGSMCLMVRIGNAARSELINVTGFGVLVERSMLPKGGEMLSESILEFFSENGNETLDLLWPAVIHCTIRDNPVEFIKKLQSKNTELIVTIEGTLKSTGQTLQLRSSYLCHEMEIGKQFVDISPKLVFSKDGRGLHHAVDYAAFNTSQSDPEWGDLYGIPAKSSDEV